MGLEINIFQPRLFAQSYKQEKSPYNPETPSYQKISKSASFTYLTGFVN
jgi:hypothetical protein